MSGRTELRESAMRSQGRLTGSAVGVTRQTTDQERKTLLLRQLSIGKELENSSVDKYARLKKLRQAMTPQGEGTTQTGGGVLER